MTPDPDQPAGETAMDLLGEVALGVTQLLKGEFALIRAEAQRSMRDATSAIVILAAAGVLGIVALNLLAAAAVAALVAAGLSLVWANIAVGAVLLLAAIAIIKHALTLLSPSNLAPKRSFANLRQDTAILKSMVTPNATPDLHT